jgi:hypothetical protein
MSYSQNRWHVAKFEASGARCEVVAVYGQSGDGLVSDPSQIVLSDGRPLVRVAKGRYETRSGVIVVSADPDAP